MKKVKTVDDWDLLMVPTDPENVWECDWEIHLKSGDKACIGKCSFAGKKERGTIPFYIEIDPLYRDKNYATHAIARMVQWAFLYRDVIEVTVLIDHENSAAIAAFQKAGFVYRDVEGTTETYSVIKEKSDWTGLYIIIGIILGFAFGIILSNVWVGFVTGMLICLLAGAKMDLDARKERESITGKKEVRNSFKNNRKSANKKEKKENKDNEG